MITVKKLPEFEEWLDGLKDRITRLRLSRRLDKVQRGQMGDVSRLVPEYLKCVNILALDGACTTPKEATC